METNHKIRNNRQTLLAMIAQCEDIARTNNRIHQLLTNVMHNPIEKDNLNESLEELFQKVMKLKKGDISGPLMAQEDTIVPTKSDISPKEDPDWQLIQQQQRENSRLQKEAERQRAQQEKITPEEETHNEALEEATNKPKPPKRKVERPQRQEGKRPQKPQKKQRRGFFGRKTEDTQGN